MPLIPDPETTTEVPGPEPLEVVERFFKRVRCDAGVTDALDLDVSPDGRLIAFTAIVRTAGAPDEAHHVAVLDLATGKLTRPDRGRRPRWTRDGTRLAWLGDSWVETARHDTGPWVARRWRLPGVPEYLEWRPDGGALLVGLAEHGAERSDVDGSGRLPGGPPDDPGSPVVSVGRDAAPGRGLWLVDPGGGTPVQVSPADRTVWQAAWAGSSAIVCVVSHGATESDWYEAELALLDPRAGAVRTLLSPGTQIGFPAANPSGSLVSAVVGAMSDRGLYGGDLVVLRAADGEATAVDTAGVDVTCARWESEDTVVFAGLRGLDTVIGRFSVAAARTEVLWESDATCGGLLPEVAVGGGVVACTTHSYREAPALSVLTPDGDLRRHLSFSRPRTAVPRESAERFTWSAPDGQVIEGLLVTPPTPGPYPLVVNIHGGPVWAWRDEWALRHPLVPLLVGQGYAVLSPNMRGSLGRGQKFVTAGLHDMGGADADDLLAAVEALVAAGRVDGRRVGVTGNSYGGFMSAWLIAHSDRFAAAVARSPVTDWVSQHHTSNIPGFDRMCLDGDPLDPASDYRTRSPLYRAQHVRTPVLLMAGAHDLATPPEQAAMFHRALSDHGRDSTLVIYPDEGHGVRAHAAVVDQAARLLEFFDRHLAAAGEE
ncbi:S9 family peptidase [Streptomyces sp. NBC_00878]|uniref:S9 family peptidase n=1 Tax=Streptomyces sp. NBC_00878 TaxID=2975854 RepID=UPI00225BF799|nr:S9 family peptidase [Streptomyces sp. NBC_00878]MCX4911683.1 S9 family peptidase [Streptomyces sp. NBC_00878]